MDARTGKALIASLCLLLAGPAPSPGQDGVLEIRLEDGSAPREPAGRDTRGLPLGAQDYIRADGTIVLQTPTEIGYDDLSGQPPPEPEPEPVPVDPLADADFDPSQFKVSGSTYFFLHFAPSPAGWDAYGRVREEIDSCWDEVSNEFGSLYGPKVKAIIYTSGGHYHVQSGGPAWSGGFYTPDKAEVHVPAPAGVSGRRLRALLVHELTHFRLDALTEGKIGEWRFLNEGLAQVMEEPHEAQGPQKLGPLRRYLEQGGRLMPYASMTRGIPGDVNLFYAQSWATAAWLQAEQGNRARDALLERIKKGERLDAALEGAIGMDAEGMRAAVEAWVRAQ